MQSNNKVTMIGCSYFLPSVQKLFRNRWPYLLKVRFVNVRFGVRAPLPRRNGDIPNAPLQREIEAAEDRYLLSSTALTLVRMIGAIA